MFWRVCVFVLRLHGKMSETSDTETERAFKLPRINYICPWEGCGGEFRREKELDRHYFTHTGIKKYSCALVGCTKRFLILDNLRRHMKVSHETDSPAEIPCKDEKCGMIFTNRSNMVRHYRQKHECPRIFKCLECQEVFRRKDQLRRHRIQHTGQFPHVCDSCGKGFVNLKAFRAHGVVHRRLKCPQCDQEVANWTELVRHRRRDHKKTFKCSTCDKEFRLKSRLMAHEVIHKPREQQPNFTCDLCGREYTRKSNLVAHIRSAHLNLRYCCKICQSTLTTERKFRLHMTKIHPEEPRQVRYAPQRPRQRRKDTGKPKVSMASRLANVSASRQVENMLISNEGDYLEMNYSPVQISGSATDTESEKNLPISGVKVTLKRHI